MNELLKKTDLCVKCGLCLPHCPTYNKTQNENNSPRGRIALIQAWTNGQLTDIHSSIDSCLLCRECESVCPALVPYSEIIDEFRAQHPKKQNLSSILLTQAIKHKTLAKTALKLYQHSFLKHSLKYLGLNRVERLLSDVQEIKPLNDYYPVENANGTVGLFIGCLSELFDVETIDSAIKLLNYAGFNVIIPKQAVCCGALARHSGDLNTAKHYNDINQNVFAKHHLTSIISIASGCGSQLQDTLTLQVFDISEFLVNYQFDCLPLNKTVCLHTPCSLKNGLHRANAALNLLKQIPKLTIQTLDNIGCCGSAGDYMLNHELLSDALLTDVLNQLEKYKPDYVLTSNIGCTLHIKAGIKERSLSIKVLHPISLLLKQLNINLD